MSESPGSSNGVVYESGKTTRASLDTWSIGVGAAIGGVVGVFLSKRSDLGGLISRGLGAVAREERVEQSAAAVRQLSEIQSSLRRMEKVLPESESRLGSRLQEQERHISSGMSSHYSRLNKSLEVVHAYGQSLMEATGKIDELQSIFHSPRTRGLVGEMQLEALVKDAWPPHCYAFQSRLSNGSRPDCVLKLPHPIGNLIIDSKFPLDAFRDMQQADSSVGESGGKVQPPIDKDQARKKLSKHLREHVRAIATKYIIPGETASSAVLFLPSEAIFAEVVEHHQVVVTEAFRENVWITSPTTLMAMLATMRATVRDVTVSQRVGKIMQEVRLMEADMDRLKKRSDDVEKNFDKARESLRQMNISAEKVARRRQNMASLSGEGDEEESGMH